MEKINLVFYLTISLILIISASVSGIFFAQKNLKEFLEKNLHYLVSFSAGVFCFLSFEMFLESNEILENLKYTSALFLTGFLGTFTLIKIFPQLHQHHDHCCDHSHKSNLQIRKILIGDALHTIGDGIVLISTFLVSIKLGILLTISIVIHEFLRELSEFFVLIESGFSRNKALAYNFLISFNIIVGVVIGYSFSTANIINGIMLSFASGIFLDIVVNDFIPHHFNKIKKNKSDSIFTHLLLIILGIFFMLTIMKFFKG